MTNAKVTETHMGHHREFRAYLSENAPSWTRGRHGTAEIRVATYTDRHVLEIDAREVADPDKPHGRYSEKRVMFTLDEDAAAQLYAFLQRVFEDPRADYGDYE